MNINATQDTVLQAGSADARLAKIYAAALLLAADRQHSIESTGKDLDTFVREVLDGAPNVARFLASPVVGRHAKSEAMAVALPGNASELFRGLIEVMTRNGRLALLRGVATAYRLLLDEREGRVPVKVTTALETSDSQRSELIATLARLLKHEPILSMWVEPDLLGGMIVQIGDRVIDTSIRTRLLTLRNRLLEAHR